MSLSSFFLDLHLFLTAAALTSCDLSRCRACVAWDAARLGECRDEDRVVLGKQPCEQPLPPSQGLPAVRRKESASSAASQRLEAEKKFCVFEQLVYMLHQLAGDQR